MKSPTRAITVLSLVQFLFICIGFLLTHGMLHLYRKFWEGILPSPDFGIPYVPLLVSKFGLCFLIAPALWWGMASFRDDPEREGAGPDGQLLIGLVLTATVALLFSFSAAQSMVFYFKSWG
jgi:TRAP-type C4-dicarboxylate transport system permease small subunit